MKTVCLSAKHRVFVEGVAAHGNQRLAYMTAYPSSSSAAARANACRLMKSPKISKAVAEAKRARLADTGTSRKSEQVKNLHDTVSRIAKGELATRVVVMGKTGKIKYVKDIIDVQAIIRAVKYAGKL